MTNQSIQTCTGTFLDPGGNYNYGNNQNFTTTFNPSQPGGQVVVDFTEFSLEISSNCANDYLLIYNGRSALSPLIGKFCGTDSPGTVTADNSFGALTFVFRSNTSVGASGWSAIVSCASAVVNPGILNAITYTDTRIDLNWELNPEANNVLLVWSADGVFGTPASGTTYNVGETIPGGGIVLYSGSETSFSHTMLTPATTYHYKAFSVNNDNLYSSGIVATATTLADPPMISIDPLVLNANAAAGTSIFNVNSNTDWTAVSDAEWCNVTPSGSGAGPLNANYTENVIAVERAANITVTVLGLEPVVVTLVQAGAAPVLSVDPMSINVVSSAGSADIAVTSNAPWTVESDSPWAVPTPAGMGDGVITIQYEENARAEARTANIAISVAGLGQTIVVLNQDAAVAVLAIEPPLAEVTAQAGSVDFNITANFNWVASTDASWLTIPANGTGNLLMNAVYAENQSLESRSATITISGNDLQQVASLIQAAGEPTLFVSPETVEVTYFAGTTELTVTSNTDWTATDNADWMTITEAGSGNGTITVNYTENPAYVDRTAVITITIAGKDPVLVNITQRASEVGIIENGIDGLSIYPNPATSQFVIEANTNMYPNMTVRLTDAAGRTVLSQECKGNERYTFDISGIAEGAYTVNILSNDKNVTRKIVVVR